MFMIILSGFAIGAGIASAVGTVALVIATRHQRKPYRHATHNANVLAYVEAKRRNPGLGGYRADVDYTRPMGG